MAEGTLEPWLRGTKTDVEPLLRAVLHALQLAREDVERWALSLSAEELAQRPFDLPSVAFQVRHIARSVDRLLTYAEGEALNERQFALLAGEMDAATAPYDLRREFIEALTSAESRLLKIDAGRYAEARTVGRAALPTTVAGLLIHIAEHTQRHVGQAVTTAKVVKALTATQQS